MKPIIGITCDYANVKANDENGSIGQARLAEGYYKGIEMAGGLPVIIPIIEDENIEFLINRMQGIVFSGGQDTDPLYYGEEPIKEIGSINPFRDRCEIKIARIAMKRGMPVLGICRGMQLLNVAMNGTLYQDIHSQIKDKKVIKHVQAAPTWYGTHQTYIKENTLLREILEVDKACVNSFHHQAVKELGEGFIVNALSSDGIIEGIENKNHRFAVGVQWHPEKMWESNRLFLKLFEGLVEAARDRALE